ncbi:MAG: holo-ACP synthase [Gammaproteobacteria bacterium]|nr:holo-ACP synthase [Gammaproteobacteria bacterium]
MIYGVGMDLVEVARITTAHDRWGLRFALRLLTDIELPEWQCHPQPDRLLARRFAAKEAASKALGTGMRDGVSFRSISVGHDHLGKPLLEFHGEALALLRRRGIVAAHLSITDERQFAAAVVVLEAAT